MITIIEMNFDKISLDQLIELGKFQCECGKTHYAGKIEVLIEKGAVRIIPELLKQKNCFKPFVLSGKDTFLAAGEKVCSELEKAGIEYSSFIFKDSPVSPTEYTVGSMMMNYDYSCDCIIAVGSGVINDTAKFLAKATGLEFFLVATAPSMDGFVSSTSSMERDGLKVSINTTYAQTIIGDLDVLCNAPMHMIAAGVGDMLAKYISLAEWKISNIITGEYYCQTVERIVKSALNDVVKAVPKLKKRDPDAVKSVMEGLIIAGIAMNYAGVSRPASGIEHYFSHIWDMRSLAFEDAKHDLHGIQCGIGTLNSIKLWNYIKAIKPDREKALEYVKNFSVEEWNKTLRRFIGPGAEAMIQGEEKEKKYGVGSHKTRLDRIIEHWQEIIDVIDTMPSYEKVYSVLSELDSPLSAEYIGYDKNSVALCMMITKDIRDKYIGSRLLWDIGEIEEAAKIVSFN